MKRLSKNVPSVTQPVSGNREDSNLGWFESTSRSLNTATIIWLRVTGRMSTKLKAMLTNVYKTMIMTNIEHY